MENNQDPALLAKRKELEAKKQQLLGVVPADAAAASSATEEPSSAAPVQQSTPAAPPTDAVVKEENANDRPQAGTVEWYRAEAERLKREKDTVAGSLGAKLHAVEQEKNELARKLAEFDRHPETVREPVVPEQQPTAVLSAEKAREIMSANIPGTDWSQYDDTEVIAWALPFMRSPGSDAVVQLTQRLEQMEEQAAYKKFCASVELQAPGFTRANGDPLVNVPGDSGWTAYLNEPLFPGSPQTRGAWLGDHGTAEVTAQMFVDFSSRGSAPAPQNNSMLRPVSIEGQVEPAQTTGRPSGDGSKRYRREVVEAFRNDLMHRKIPLTAETQAIFREYQMAEREGRLD